MRVEGRLVGKEGDGGNVVNVTERKGKLYIQITENERSELIKIMRCAYMYKRDGE